MRFCLTFEIENKEFPIEYASCLISFIKSSISKCNDGKYFDSFFKDNTRKDYCFSVILPKSKFKKDRILLEGNEIKVIFTTGDSMKTGLILFSSFIGMKGKTHPLPNGNSMILTNISNLKSEVIYSSRAIFKTSLGSSLCVREHDKETNKDKYYVCDDKEFNERLMMVVKNQLLKAGFSEWEVNDIAITPIQSKKVVVKFYRRFIDSNIGMFEIKANSDILQHIYDVGLGSRRNASFGMLDLVTQDL